MKIKIKIADLVAHITQAAITVDRKAGDAPGSKIYLRAKTQVKPNEPDKHFLYLFSTDQMSKTFLKKEISEILEEGQLLIDPGKLLGGLIGRDPDAIAEIESETEAGKIKVKIGKSKVNLPLNVTVEPAVAIIKSLPSGEAIAKIPANTLLSFIKRSSFCIPIADNGQQSFAMGVLNLLGTGGNYIAQGTDGNIVVWNKAKQTESTKFDLESLLIPVESLHALTKLLSMHKDTDVELLAGPRNSKGALQEIFFRMEGVLYGTVLRVGAYPNIETLLNSNAATYTAEISKDEFKSALLRSGNFVDPGASKTIKLSSTNAKTITLEAANSLSDINDQLDATIDENKHKNVSVLISLDYLANITSTQDSETILLGFNIDKAKAITVSNSSEDLITKYAVMPILPEKKIGKSSKKKEE